MTEAAWFIDALDGRGGICFASHRKAGAEQTGDHGDESIYFAPPDFAPVSLASPATGFAATAGAFQERMFLNDREVAFADVDQLVDFVRRTYLSSGGGDGDGAGGPPRTPEDQPRDEAGEVSFEFPEQADLDGSAVLQSAVQKSFPATVGAGTGEGHDSPHSCNWESLAPHPGGGSVCFRTAPLLRAATSLYHELLWRLPRSPADEIAPTWINSAQLLGRVVERLGLPLSVLADQQSFNVHMDRLEKFLAQYSGYKWWADLRAHTNDGTAALFPFHPHLGAWLWYYRGRHFPFRSTPWPRLQEERSNAMRELVAIPVPREIAEGLPGLHWGHEPSLFTLLTCVVAAPAPLAGNQRATDVLLFSACNLQEGLLPGEGAFRTRFDESAARRLDMLQQAALEWLRRSLPRYEFPLELEKSIAKAVELRYAGDEGVDSA